ncbi:MAG: quinone-dependent dihydroorotate dehydrogenase, partial [Akkermansiaceae bacterium]|nr:quinone-dependent dihydroorotate dehydrogenase [Akkermansiaceae bacterium]
MIDALYPLARKCLFRLEPESAHELSMKALRLAERSRLLGLFSPSGIEGQAVEVMGLRFPNRVGLAAGLDKEGNTIDALGRLGFGHIEVGTITPKAQSGNPQPRLFRLTDHQAIINRMGFNNSGIDAGVLNVLAANRFHRRQGIVGFNIGKNKVTPNEQAADDYLACLRK